jgi:hypothetical protein
MSAWRYFKIGKPENRSLKVYAPVEFVDGYAFANYDLIHPLTLRRSSGNFQNRFHAAAFAALHADAAVQQID